MCAIVRAVQVVFIQDSAMTKKLLDLFHRKIYGRLYSEEDRQTILEKLIHRRYSEYYEILTDDKDNRYSDLGKKLFENIFSRESKTSDLAFTYSFAPGIYSSTLTTTTEMLKVISSKFEIV